jgi:hypothetical protein
LATSIATKSGPTEYRSSRSRSPTTYIRQNTYVNGIAAGLSPVPSTSTTALQHGVPKISPPAYLNMNLAVQSQGPPSPTHSSISNGVRIMGHSTPTMPLASMMKPAQSFSGGSSVMQMASQSLSHAADPGNRSVSPPRTRRVESTIGSPKGIPPQAQERVSVSRPFRRLVSNSIGISSEP